MDNNNKDRELSAELFGNVRQATKVGGLEPDLDQIKQELGSQPLCPCFCTDCGTTLSLTAQGAQSLMDYHELLAITPGNTLIIVDGCPSCDEEFRNIRTQAIEP